MWGFACACGQWCLMNKRKREKIDVYAGLWRTVFATVGGLASGYLVGAKLGWW